MLLSVRRYSAGTLLVLVLLWLVATALNLNKAFHIDDTFHLEAAQWIEKNPLRPMSALINWDNNSIPIYHYNQPPLYFYLIAAIGSFFGYSEIPLHLFQSLFTLLAIVTFYKIAATFYPRHALLLTALLVLNPAFLVNQNLMVDIPLVSLHLLFIYILVKPDIKTPLTRYCLAALVLSMALLIKYTSLPLVVVLLLTPLIRREQKYIVAGLIPFIILGLWSVFNYYEYGSIHLHSRPASVPTSLSIGKQLLAFILCLGAVAPFSIAFITGISEKTRQAFAILTVLAVAIFLGVTWLWYMDLLTASMTRKIFWGGFVINGIVTLVIVFSRQLPTLVSFDKFRKNPANAVLILWGAGLGAFLVLFAPFMATRHVLLVIPPILLLSAALLDTVSYRMKILAVVFSAGLALLLGISDWVYADFYRKQPYLIKAMLPETATVWSVGHWGWQWYSRDAGMQLYETDSATVAVNDYIVAPKHIAKQELSDKHAVEEVESFVPASNKLTYFSTGLYASFYTSDYLVAPWALAKAPIDTIQVFRVTNIKPAE